MLTETIQNCKSELNSLANAREALRTAIKEGYTYGADLDYLESLDRTIQTISKQIAHLEEVKAHCHRKLEEAGELEKSLALA